MSKLLWGLLLSLATLLPPLALGESERGMSGESDFRFGPIFHGGVTLFSEQPADRQYYLLELRGENPKAGYSRIFLRIITLYELLELPPLNVPQPVPGTGTLIRFHQQFVSLGFESPIFYGLTRPLGFEWGWTSGFTLSRVVFKQPQKGQTGEANGLANLLADFPEIPPASLAQQKARETDPDSQFIGAELGSYLRFYTLYPWVPYISGRLSLGNFFDTVAFIEGTEEKPLPGSVVVPTDPSQPAQKKRIFQSAFTLGGSGSVGLDYFLFSRGLIGVEYVLWNWNFSRPQDFTHTLALKAGFLF